MRPSQILLYVLIVAVGWFVAAQFIRFAGPHIFDGSVAHAAMFVLTALCGPAFVWLAALAVRLPFGEMLPPITLMTVTALLLDGIAISWVPFLYGGTGPNLAYGAAWLLWGVGAIFLAALMLAQRPKTARSSFKNAATH